MSKNSIDKLHDNPQTGDRIVFDSETGPSEIIIRRDGDTIYCTKNNGGSEMASFTRDIEIALTADGDDAHHTESSDPTETRETIAEFRERILTNLGSVRLVILEPREGDGYKVDTAIIDELHDNPQTGDRIAFNLGMGAFTRTLVVRDGRISYEEVDKARLCFSSIQQFRNYIIGTLDGITVVTLAPRGKKR